MGSSASGKAATTREFADATGTKWTAVAIDQVVAHGRPGAQLAFLPADDAAAEPLRSRVTFNSHQAADFALRTLGEKELQRRLTLAQAEAGTL
jgi:hypothetical protein